MFGGTFNPPHNGHVTMARAAVNQLGLDKLLIVPDCVPPHKPLPSGVTARQRYDMAALMAASVGRMAEASDIELHHTGKSYTSDTLRMLHQQYPDAELWLLMGSDMFLSLHTWHEPEVICELAHIAAFRRVEEDIHAAMEQQKTQLERQYQAHVACDNVYYWSKRKGFDSRVTWNGNKDSSGEYSAVRAFSAGLSLQF